MDNAPDKTGDTIAQENEGLDSGALSRPDSPRWDTPDFDPTVGQSIESRDVDQLGTNPAFAKGAMREHEAPEEPTDEVTMGGGKPS